MKKLLLLFISIMFVLSFTMVSYAGDIPEGLLNTDTAEVYFGEIKSIDGERITVIQRQNIKGEFLKDSEHTYETFLHRNPKIGETYLCGFLNTHNPLYIWSVSGLELSNLKIADSQEGSGVTQRMEQYLNDGTFTEKEQERLSKLEAGSTAETKSCVMELSSLPAPAANDEITADSATPAIHSEAMPIFVVAALAVVMFTVFFVTRKRKKN